MGKKAIAIMIYVFLGAAFIARLYPFAILPDEFGYWQNVALVRGIDWSEVNALGDYYSFGYSIILLPIHLLVKSPLTAYRVALILNLLMMLVGAFVLARMLDSNPILIAVYPPLLYYALTTMSEAVLFMIFALSLFFMKKYLDDRKARDCAMLLALLIFLFTIHMRTLPLLVIALLLLRDKEEETHSSKKTVILFGAMILILFGASLYAGWYFQRPIVMANGAAGTGFYGVLSKLKGLYSLNGLKRFVIALVGEFFYIGVATLGLGYLGLKRIIRKVREKQDFEYFLLMSLICEMALSALFLYSYQSSLSVVYGRYIDFMMPVLMAYGYAEMNEEMLGYHELITMLVVMAVAVIITAVNVTGFDVFESMFAIGTNYLMIKKSSPVEVIAAAGILSSSFILVLFILRKRGERKIISGISTAIITTALTLFAFLASRNMAMENIGYARENIDLANRLSDESGEIVYLKYGDELAIQVLQFMIPDRPIKVADTYDELEKYDAQNRYIVTFSYDKMNEQFQGKYELYDETRTFKVWK